jgi:hypothetical protein
MAGFTLAAGRAETAGKARKAGKKAGKAGKPEVADTVAL